MYSYVCECVTRIVMWKYILPPLAEIHTSACCHCFDVQFLHTRSMRLIQPIDFIRPNEIRLNWQMHIAKDRINYICTHPTAERRRRETFETVRVSSFLLFGNLLNWIHHAWMQQQWKRDRKRCTVYVDESIYGQAWVYIQYSCVRPANACMHAHNGACRTKMA